MTTAMDVMNDVRHYVLICRTFFLCIASALQNFIIPSVVFREKRSISVPRRLLFTLRTATYEYSCGSKKRKDPKILSHFSLVTLHDAMDLDCCGTGSKPSPRFEKPTDKCRLGRLRRGQHVNAHNFGFVSVASCRGRFSF